MDDEKIVPKEGEETPKSGAEKEDEKNQPKLDDEGNHIDQKKEDVVKKEGEGEIVDPYDKKLEDLKKSNQRQSVALVEKNKKINDLKDELKDKGFTPDQINEVVTKVVEEKLGDMKADAEELKKLKEILADQAISNAVKEVAVNPGEAKIIKFFYDHKVNKTLPFAEQVQQAAALARSEMNDPVFQAEVEKANISYTERTGKKLEDLPVSEGAKIFANAVFKSDKAKQVFFDKIGKGQR